MVLRVRFVVLHYHFVPGGVRRVIELATPSIARHLGSAVSEVVFAGGLEPPAEWMERMVSRLAPLRVRAETEPCLNYLAAQQHLDAGSVAKRARAFLEQLLPANGEPTVVWAHNQSLARNLVLSRTLVDVTRERGAQLVLHHHDWWFDSRWQRWPEFKHFGFADLRQIASATLPGEAHVRHAVISRADAAMLEPAFPGQSAWIPNPVSPEPEPPAEQVAAARQIFQEATGETSAVWLMPIRLLRRKNIAEALLLTRWLRPQAWLVTTAGVSSHHEQPYADRLHAEIARQGWRVRLSVLSQRNGGVPPFSSFLHASEALLLTSVQEGFGLPYLEAAAAQKPILARTLPNIQPDLERFGFTFPQSYADVWIGPEMYDWKSEVERQERVFGEWLKQLPTEYAAAATPPRLLARSAEPVPFSQLTLEAQLEVLRAPAESSFKRAAALNPFLETWRDLAQKGALKESPWPETAGQWLDVETYGERFSNLLACKPAVPVPAETSLELQDRFTRLKLAPLYPLLLAS